MVAKSSPIPTKLTLLDSGARSLTPKMVVVSLECLINSLINKSRLRYPWIRHQNSLGVVGRAAHCAGN